MQLHRFHELAAGGAAHVDADVGGAAHRSDLARFIVAPHFPQLDADGIHAARIDQAQRIGCRLNAFVGHDRRAHVLAHKCHAAHVVAAHRLFANDQITALQFVQHLDRAHRRVGLVGVNGNEDIVAQSFASDLYGLNVALVIEADLDLDVAIAAIHKSLCLGGRLLRRLQTEHAHDRYISARQPAEQVKQRRLHALRLQIQQRFFDGKLELEISADGEIDFLHHIRHAQDLFLQQGRDRCVQQGFRGHGRFADD